MNRTLLILLISLLILMAFVFCGPAVDITVMQGDTIIENGGSFDIGEGPVNQNTEITFTIKNNSGKEILVESIEVAGTDSAQFSFKDNYFGSIIEGEGEMDFVLVYEPIKAGSKQARIIITISDEDETQYTINLMGTTPAHEWHKVNVSVKPSPRSLPATAYADDYNKVILFGGLETNKYNDTWEFDVESMEWTKLIDNNPTSTDIPAVRRGHDLAYLGNGNVLLFGGSDSSKYDDTWVYNIDNNEWTEISPASHPSARVGLRMDGLGNGKAVLFGGDASNRMNDVWVYDHSGQNWTEETFVSTTNPDERSYAGMTAISSDKIIIFGGSGESAGVTFNDTWEYDLTTHEWTDLAPAGDIPNNVTYTEIVFDGVDTIVIFGGLNQTSPLFSYDTSEYSISNNEWTQIIPDTHPEERALLSLADMGTGMAMTFGGMKTTDQPSTIYFNDTYVYFTGAE